VLYFYWMKATASLQARIRGMFIEENVQAEKRKSRRARYTEPVSFQLKDPHHFGGCLGRDLSEGGIRVDFNEFIPLNTEMVLQLKLGSISKVVDVTGRVAWLQRVPYSDRYAVGLQFTKADPVSHEEIRRYIDTHHS